MFLIRADGNAQIGAGHLMRCLTIAEEFAALYGRENICFVCAEVSSAELVVDDNFQAYVLGTDYQELELELSEWDRLPSELRLKKSLKKPVILVDSYYVTDKYLASLRAYGYVVLLDDFGEHCYPVDCVINYNAPADPWHYRRLYQGKDVMQLIGNRYTPVRRQFCDAAYQVKEEVHSVLITTGGGDQDNIAGKILERLYDRNWIFYLVTGRFNPNLQKLKELENNFDNVHICYDVKNMAELMEKCDVAVTAGGSTVYELAAVGVPFICFSYAENQEILTNYIRAENITGEAGAWHKDPEKTLEAIALLFESLIRDWKKRVTVSQRIKSMVDCKGAVRLAEELNKYYVT